TGEGGGWLLQAAVEAVGKHRVWALQFRHSFLVACQPGLKVTTSPGYRVPGDRKRRCSRSSGRVCAGGTVKNIFQCYFAGGTRKTISSVIAVNEQTCSVSLMPLSLLLGPASRSGGKPRRFL
ncbi:unnamed protein product, partial [Ectocarpus sp. 13 AM-2016]